MTFKDWLLNNFDTFIEFRTGTVKNTWPAKVKFLHRFVTNSFLADRTNGRAIGTVLCLSVCLSSVCDVMYYG